MYTVQAFVQWKTGLLTVNALILNKKKVTAKSPHIEQYSSFYKYVLSLLHLVMLELRLSGATLGKMIQSSSSTPWRCTNRNS